MTDLDKITVERMRSSDPCENCPVSKKNLGFKTASVTVWLHIRIFCIVKIWYGVLKYSEITT